MNPLVLTEYGRSLCVNNGKICLTSRKRGTGIKLEELQEWTFDEFPFNCVVVRNITGSMSLEVIHTLAYLKVPVLFLRFNGELESILLPAYGTTHGKIKLEQMKIALDSSRSKIVSEAIQTIHIRNMKHVLGTLGYPVERGNAGIPAVDLEGSYSAYYWSCLTNWIKKNLPKFTYTGRRPVGYRYNFSAMSEINSLRNYVGALHESLVRKYIQETGLTPEIGFGHSHQIGKEPLIWDAIDLLRTHLDVLTLKFLLSKQVAKSDFRRLDNLEVYLTPEACKKVVALVADWFGQDSGVRLTRNVCSWESVVAYNIRQMVPMEARHTRVGELGQFKVPLPEVKPLVSGHGRMCS